MDPAQIWQLNFDSLFDFFVPELILAVTVVLILCFDLFVGKNQPRNYTYWPSLLALFGLVSSFALLMMTRGAQPQKAFMGMVSVDPFGFFFRVLSIGVTFVTIVMATRSKDTREENVGEFNALLLILCMGMMFLASANDLIMLYLSLETVSITSYILVGYTRGSRRSSEAALKYLLYGAVASGTMLFGLSILYGLAGSTDISVVAEAVRNATGGARIAAAVAGVLAFAGFGYKIAAAPFHMWAPDVYEGAPTPVTAFLTVGSKAAGFAAFVRFFITVMAVPHGGGGAPSWDAVGVSTWPVAIAVVAGFTMTIGNFAAIGQNNVKRLLGYSSIAHAGYMLMGLVTLSGAGLRALIFYMVVYYFMNLGAFLVVTVVSNELGSEDIEAFRGLGWRSPFAGASMAIFLFSLVGLPPLAGFIGKYHLFAALVTKGMGTGTAFNWYYTLAIVAALNSVVSLFYYARVVKAMYLDTPRETSRVALAPSQAVLMFVLVAPTLILGISWGWLMDRWIEPSTQILGALF